MFLSNYNTYYIEGVFPYYYKIFIKFFKHFKKFNVIEIITWICCITDNFVIDKQCFICNNRKDI